MKTKDLRKISTPVFAILALIIFGAITITAAPGDLDPKFGTGGKVITVLPDSNSARKMAIQPDGKIIVQGRSVATNFSGSSFLARYNADGTLDAGFGINGTVIIPLQAPLYENFGYGLTILPDGKILVSGFVSVIFDNGTVSFAILRFNGDGSRDTAFGTNGVAFTSVSPNGIPIPPNTFFKHGVGSTLQVQPDGKIAVVGNIYGCDFSDFCYPGTVVAVRFNADGSVDNAFGTSGKLIITSPIANEFVSSNHFDVLPDGKLLLIGGTTDAIGISQKVFLSRINANGILDTSFGTNGFVLPELNQPGNSAFEFALQSDGKIVFPTSNLSHNIVQSSTIVRLNADGTPHTSFGTNGKVIIPAAEGFFSSAGVIQTNGKILAGGTTSGANPTRFAIIRLNADGSRDISFGANGIITTLLASYSNAVVDMTLQADGKLVAYGTVRNPATGENDIGLARYLLDATRRALFDFDGDGKSDISVFRQSDRIWYLNQSTAGFSATQFGLSTDKITPADFDGDGKADIAVYRDGVWYRLNSSNGTVGITSFGIAGDLPQPADFDGDGRAELAVYRNGTWWTLNLTNNQVNTIQFGLSTDKPVAADYDGDGRADQAVYRNGEWHLNQSSQGYAVINFGLANDKLVPADYDGDGKTDQAVYRNGIWYLLRSSQGFAQLQFGLATDIPTPADYDGDGRTDIAVYRNGNWYIRQSSNGQVAIQQFGLSSDIPVAGANQ